ncbi:MAG: 3-ketoacyl-ACP reductase [Bacteroidales bacterium]|nr:3-ketoacyl-ACP reductase [Bacteroidales bacterium]
MTVNLQTALVTGASRGIGKAICIELLQSGYSVIGLSRNIQSTDSLLNEIAKVNQVSYLAIQADVSDIQAYQRVYDFVQKEFGTLNLLVHNAGVAPLERTDVLEMSLESYSRVMQINLLGPIFLTQKLFPLMEQVESGSIVYVTSISAEVASINRGEYCISKAGLSMFAKLMAERLAKTKINVFEIRPGVIETDMTKPVLDKYNKMIDEGLVPIGRIGQPEDIARALKALVSGDFSYTNGMCVEISGGMQIRTL